MFDKKTYKLNAGNEIITVETGEVARQAGGSVLISKGDTTLLVTATRSKDVKEGQDFFPLTVDFQEVLLKENLSLQQKKF